MNDDQLNACLAVLEAARELEPDDPRYVRLERAVAHLVKTAKKKRRRARRRAKVAEDRARLRATGLAEKRFGPAQSGAAQRPLHHERLCYVCRSRFRVPHHFFPTMCPGCGDASMARRAFEADLRGRRALVTGGRVKIGYATALALLRAGATVHATTRFPRDAAARYAAEPDFADWRDRLEIHGLDFRALPALLVALEAWRAGPPLDIVVNNAAQTVWHPPEHYRALWAAESATHALPVRVHGAPPAPLALVGAPLPTIDLSRQNSWTQRLDEIAPIEMVEVQVVNALAPSLIVSRLKANLLRSPFADRYVVNVSAAEGRFDRRDTSARHPHTNMAKAAVNMLTHTSAADYARDGIYMVSVDPGWMSHEGPPALQAVAEARGFHPPLEAEDCAARVLDPIARGVAGAPIYGVLLKDFRSVPW